MILTKLSSWFSNLTRTNRFLLNLFLILFIALLDRITPPEFNMRLFYLIPISLSVWYEKEIKTGIFFSILSTSLYYFTELSRGIIDLHGFYLIWELLIVCGFYIIIVVIVHKINKARVTLQQSEKKFRNLFDNSEVGMFRTRLDGSEILDFNEKYLRILNYTRDEIKGKPSANIWADKSERDMMVKTLIAEGHVTDLEFDLLNKQGEVRRCITSLQLYRDTGILEGSILDITDRKRGEETQLKITERLSLACRAGGIGIWELDIVNNNLIWDDQMFNLYGITPDKFSGTYEAWRAGVHPEDLQKSEKELQMSIRGEKDLDTEFRIVWPDGTIHTIRALAFLQRDASGQPINIIGTNYKITEFKQTEEALRESQSLYYSFIEQLPNAVFRKDIEDRYILVNSQFCRLKGLKKEDFIGKTPMEVAVNEISKQGEQGHATKYAILGEDVHKLILQTGKIFEKEEEYSDMDGGIQYMHVVRMPVFDFARTIIGTQGIMFDITALKRAEEEISRKNKQLQELNATKDKFFSIIAHDLKSPFLGFLSLTQTIAEDASKISAQELAQIGSIMYQAADNLFNLLQNLLEWAQMQSGSISLMQKDISLSEMIAKNVEVIKDRSEQKKISINNIITDPIHAYADEKMINSVLLNLISNAVKFTHRNGTVTISAKKTEDQMIEISIRDTGVGMSKSVVDKLFKVGERIGTKGTDGELSTGLGLVLCKEFIDKNDGKIWVESEEGVGSTFYFTLQSRE